MLCFSPSPPHTPHISEPRLVLFLPSTSLWSVPSVAGEMASAQRGYFCPRFLEWTLCTSGFQTCRVSRKKRGKKKEKEKVLLLSLSDEGQKWVPDPCGTFAEGAISDLEGDLSCLWRSAFKPWHRAEKYDPECEQNKVSVNDVSISLWRKWWN